MGSTLEPAAATTPSSSPPPAPDPRPRRRFRNYIIDARLQLRYVLAVVLLSASIALALGWLVHRQEEHATQTIERSLATVDEDFLPEAARERILADFRGRDRSQATLMLVVGLGLMVVLSGYLVVMTHRVAGPLHKVASALDHVRDGKLTRPRELRKGDQFGAFFARFRAMEEALRDRARTEAELYEAVVSECRRAGVDGDDGSDALAEPLRDLAALAREKRSALE